MCPELHLSLRITAVIKGFSEGGWEGQREEGRRINWRKKKTKLKPPRKPQQPAD